MSNAENNNDSYCGLEITYKAETQKNFMVEDIFVISVDPRSGFL